MDEITRERLAQVNNSPRANVFPAGEANFGHAIYGHSRTPGMDVIAQLPMHHLLGRALIWPCLFGASTFGLFGSYPSSLSKSDGFFSLAGKASLVSISDAILFVRS